MPVDATPRSLGREISRVSTTTFVYLLITRRKEGGRMKEERGEGGVIGYVREIA